MERLADKQAKLDFERLLGEHSPDALVIISPAGEVLHWTRSAERMFGYPAADALGKTVAELIVPPKRHDAEREASARTLRHGDWTYEAVHRRQDGSLLYLDVSSKVVRGDADVILRSYKDVADLKLARDLKLVEGEYLERALHERNLELENAADAKNQVLATMSHELRTPMNAIIGFTGTLLMKLPGPLTPDQQSQLETIQSSARHLMSLIDDLLDLAKIESGKAEVAFEDVDCAQLLEEVVRTLRPLAERKNLRLAVALPAAGYRLRTDKRAFGQIVINLVNNAIKFTDEGGITITAARKRIDGGLCTAVEVADTGCGISPEDQARLFGAFNPLDTSATRRHGGTGLGLRLSQKLAMLLGGRIVCSSRPGAGSSFSLTIQES